MRRRFFWAIFGVAASCVVLLALAGAVLQRQVSVQATFREMARAADEAASVVRETVDQTADLSRLLAVGDAVELRRLFLRLQRAVGGSVLTLAVVSPDGAVQSGLPFVRQLDLEFDRLAGGETQTFREPIRRGGALVLARPAVRIGEDGPMVAVVLARRIPVIDWRSQARLLLLLLVGAAAVAALAARLLSAGLARRLEAVEAAAARLSSGDLTARASVDGDDEVTRLGETFNSMATDLESSRRRERQFLLAVGHDLRTPLTTIGGYAEALEEAPTAPEETRRIATVLSMETNRLRRLIEDLMLLARLGTPEFTLRPEPVDVAAHLSEMAEGFAKRAAAERVRLTTEFQPTGIRTVDPDRLAQVLGNLIENALRYTPEAGEVRVIGSATADRLSLEVCDTGTGIDEADLPHIFESFYVAQKYRRLRPEGSGLGLSIVAGLVANMGGTVSASSPPGAGTTIAVDLPAPPA